MKVTVIHCGILNDGHKYLTRKGLEIIAAKEYEKSFNSAIIIIDEAQRMHKNQLIETIKHVKKENIICIFSYDQKQVLDKTEAFWNNRETILENTAQNWKLTSKIRTNPEMASFIINMFNKNKKNSNFNYECISIFHSNSIENAKKFISFHKDFCFINYTGSLWYNTPDIIEHFENTKNYNAHQVIGQEFDNVLVVIGENFFYDDKGNLNAYRLKNVPYNSLKMLYQAITRVRSNLFIVVINNKEVFSELIDMKTKKST